MRLADPELAEEVDTLGGLRVPAGGPGAGARRGGGRIPTGTNSRCSTPTPAGSSGCGCGWRAERRRPRPRRRSSGARVDGIRGARRALGGRRARRSSRRSAARSLALAQPPVSLAGRRCSSALPPLFWLLDGLRRGRGRRFCVGWAAGVGYLRRRRCSGSSSRSWSSPSATAGWRPSRSSAWRAGSRCSGARRSRWRGRSAARRRAARWRSPACWTLAECARGLRADRLSLGAARLCLDRDAGDAGARPDRALRAELLTLVAGLLPGRRCRGRRPAARPSLAAALVAAGWGCGAWRLAQPAPARAEPVVVRLVQPNAAQQLKWRPEMQAEFFDGIWRRRRAGRAAPDVTIWSETAVPFVLGYAAALRPEVAAAARRRAVILGIDRLGADGEGERWFNSPGRAGPRRRGRGGLRQAPAGAVRRIRAARGADRRGSAGRRSRR